MHTKARVGIGTWGEAVTSRASASGVRALHTPRACVLAWLTNLAYMVGFLDLNNWGLQMHVRKENMGMVVASQLNLERGGLY